MRPFRANRRKPISVTLSPGEYQLLKTCLDKAVPMLVYEHTMDWEWCYCPRCHAILDCEYMEHCTGCGQALSWYGTTKYAVRRSYAEVGSKEEP